VAASARALADPDEQSAYVEPEEDHDGDEKDDNPWDRRPPLGASSNDRPHESADARSRDNDCQAAVRLKAVAKIVERKRQCNYSPEDEDDREAQPFTLGAYETDVRRDRPPAHRGRGRGASGGIARTTGSRRRGAR
jgi:hypothetical protein